MGNSLRKPTSLVLCLRLCSLRFLKDAIAKLARVGPVRIEKNRCMRDWSERFLEVADRPERFFRPSRFNMHSDACFFSDNPLSLPPAFNHDWQGPALALYSAMLVRDRIENKQNRIAFLCTDHRD